MPETNGGAVPVHEEQQHRRKLRPLLLLVVSYQWLDRCTGKSGTLSNHPISPISCASENPTVLWETVAIPV